MVHCGILADRLISVRERELQERAVEGHKRVDGHSAIGNDLLVEEAASIGVKFGPAS